MGCESFGEGRERIERVQKKFEEQEGEEVDGGHGDRVWDEVWAGWW